MRPRIAAIAALAVAVLAVVLILSGGDEPYKVTAQFQNASQLVGSEVVVIGGVQVGKVEEIELGDSNEALVTFSVEDDHAPIPRGTVATVRSYSLSGIANRQIQLTLPPTDEAGEAIDDGGQMDQAETVSEVDLDQLFNTLDPETVEDLKKVIKGFADSYDGVGKPANKGFRYLNPFLSTSRRVFDELNRDQAAFERLIVDADRLSGALAERRDNVAGLISNASSAMGALASERDSLASALNQLPGFMQQFNSTAVNLRAALDDVDPLVDASKPVAEKLLPFLTELNAASENLVPTLGDLNATIDRDGTKRDLVGVTEITPELAEIAIGPVERNGSRRAGAFPESVTALEDSLPILEQLRPYAPELVGWFDDFGNSGVLDANGGIGRIGTTFNAFSLSQNGFPMVDSAPLSPEQLMSAFETGNDRRCPGALERPAPDGSNPFTDNGNVECDPTQIPPGP